MATGLGITGSPRYRTVPEERIIAWLILNGWACELGRDDESILAAQAGEALNRWVRNGLPFARTPSGERRFDPAEVMNFFILSGSRNMDPFWKERHIPTGRRLVLSHHGNLSSHGLPPPPSTLGPRHFVVTHMRDFNLQAHREGARAHLRLPLPIEDDSISGLSVNPIAPEGMGVEFTIGPGRLDAVIAVPNDSAVTLGVTACFTAYPSPRTGIVPELRPAERDLYTRSREGPICVTGRIRKLAREIAGDLPAWESLQQFWRFLLERFRCGAMHYHEIDAEAPGDWILETGWFDCHMGAALLVALCRARNIPARIIGGYLLYPSSPTHHYWAETWIEGTGWIPFDLMCLGLSMNGRDSQWSDYFAGQLDYRMKTQCLPRLFDSIPSLHLPAAWHVLTRAIPDGAETGIYVAETAELVYRDRVAVKEQR